MKTAMILIAMLSMLSVPCFATSPDTTSVENFQIGDLHWSVDFNSQDHTTLNWHPAALPQAREFGRPVLASASIPDFKIGVLNTQPSGSNAGSPTSGNSFMKRHKLHKYASMFTLPLFVAEVAIGEELNGKTRSESGGLRSAHMAVASGIGVLFGVETWTGLSNLLKAPKGTGGHGKKMFHGILMLAAEAGIVATIATAPGREAATGINRDSSTHRTLAYSSLGIASFSYLYMLLTK